MPGSNWERVQEIFLEAADLPEAEQPAWLDSACGDDAALREEVESLLRADREGAGVLAKAIENAAESILEEPDIVGMRLGAYRVTEEIGRAASAPSIWRSATTISITKKSPSRSSSTAWIPPRSWAVSATNGRSW